MDNFELCDKLVSKTGVSFSEAKSALERSNWDMLDALILLENEGKTAPSKGVYNSNSAETNEPKENQSAGGSKKTQEPSCRKDDCCGSEKRSNSDCKNEEKKARRAESRSKVHNFVHKFVNVLVRNRLVAYNNEGKQVLDVPVVIALVIGCCVFWLTVIVVLISFTKGWQYRFVGPDLGTDDINKASKTVSDAIYSASHNVKDEMDEFNKEDSVDVEFEEKKE